MTPNSADGDRLRLLPDGVRVLVLDSGKAGHLANALGVATALGADFQIVRPAPRFAFRALAPFGPADPKGLQGVDGSSPAIVIACGRVTVPYARALKKASPNDIFAVFLQDPVASRQVLDLIWAPAHDGLKGANVFSTLTSPHPFGAERLQAERQKLDGRIAALPRPRAAIILGGPSAGHSFDSADLHALAAAARAIEKQGYSVMATPSRRTPARLVDALRSGLGDAAHFVWDGVGDNPYAQILAHADALLVTADSVNMVGEALATGAPVYLFEPSGEGGKSGRFIALLKERGLVRKFEGELAPYSYDALDSTRAIAEEIATRFIRSRPGERFAPTSG